jgi:predicted PurR-regulated permease PerM
MTLSASPAARLRARERWSALADRLATIRPEALAKGAMGVAVIGVSLALATASWPALAPFVVGAVLAYAVLPVANRLDAFMPRWLASLLAELLAVALLIGVVAVVVPPLIAGLGIVAGKLPSPEKVQTWVASVQDQIGTIPEPMRSIALAVLSETATNLQGALQGLVDQAAGAVTGQILGLFGTLSNLLGLLVIPTWILTLVADERAVKQRAARLFPEAIRADVAALFRIADRVASTYLRVVVLLAVVTGVLVYAGVSIANQFGVGDGSYAVAAGVLLGALQLIPELGFVLGFATLLIPLAIGGPVAAVLLGLIYVGSVKAAGTLVEGRLAHGVLDVHPGLLIPAIVVLSQFGVFWLLAAAPLVTVVRDLVRYASLRLADPPGPAGVLPGERARRTGIGRAAVVPSVYRVPAPSAPAAAPAPAAASTPTVAAGAGAGAGPLRRTVPSVYANLTLSAGVRPHASTRRNSRP